MKLRELQGKLDELLNKIDDLDANIKIVIVVAFALIPLVTFWFGSYSPKTKQLKQLESQKVVLLQTIRKVEKDTQNIGKHRADMEEAKLMFKKASNLLPQQQDIPQLLTGISNSVRESGLSILTFQPGAESPKEFYAEIPISISVEGSYHNMGYFLDKISKMSRIITVTSLSVSGGSKLEEGEIILKASVKMKTFRFIK